MGEVILAGWNDSVVGEYWAIAEIVEGPLDGCSRDSVVVEFLAIDEGAPCPPEPAVLEYLSMMEGALVASTDPVVVEYLAMAEGALAGPIDPVAKVFLAIAEGPRDGTTDPAAVEQLARVLVEPAWATGHIVVEDLDTLDPSEAISMLSPVWMASSLPE